MFRNITVLENMLTLLIWSILMNKFKKILAVAGLLAVTACSGVHSNSEIEALNDAEAVGSPFTKYLAAEYRDYANQEHYKEYDFPDALHFARKGLAAANGEVVMPEPLDDWDLNKNHITEMTEARAQLVDVMENGARDVAAELSAVAQARFDCWVEQQEENWQDNDISNCKNAFYNALSKLQGLVKPEPVPTVAIEEELPAPVTETVVEPVQVPLEQAMFIVFFDWDKNKLSSGAEDVLDAVADEVKGRTDVSKITVSGHTDSSGAKAYNEKLSKRRAKAVKEALVARGIDSNMVVIEAKGEADMLVETADNVREPANRRAQIGLE